MNKRTIFTSALLSLTIGASLTFTAASAAQKDIILGENIHDYSNDASRNLPASSSRQERSGYNVRIVFDNAYYDYSDVNTAAFDSNKSNLERAELAALEDRSSGMPSDNTYSDIPWTSKAY